MSFEDRLNELSDGAERARERTERAATDLSQQMFDDMKQSFRQKGNRANTSIPSILDLSQDIYSASDTANTASAWQPSYGRRETDETSADGTRSHSYSLDLPGHHYSQSEERRTDGSFDKQEHQSTGFDQLYSYDNKLTQRSDGSSFHEEDESLLGGLISAGRTTRGDSEGNVGNEENDRFLYFSRQFQRKEGVDGSSTRGYTAGDDFGIVSSGSSNEKHADGTSRQTRDEWAPGFRYQIDSETRSDKSVKYSRQHEAFGGLYREGAEGQANDDGTYKYDETELAFGTAMRRSGEKHEDGTEREEESTKSIFGVYERNETWETDQDGTQKHSRDVNVLGIHFRTNDEHHSDGTGKEVKETEAPFGIYSNKD